MMTSGLGSFSRSFSNNLVIASSGEIRLYDAIDADKLSSRYPQRNFFTKKYKHYLLILLVIFLL